MLQAWEKLGHGWKMSMGHVRCWIISMKVIWGGGVLKYWFHLFSYVNQNKNKLYIVAFGNTTLKQNPILMVIQIAERLTRQWSQGCVCGAHVSQAHSKSRWIMTVAESASIVHLHCVTWEWGQQETYLLLNSNISYYHTSPGTFRCTKKNPRAHAHIRLHHWRASPLQRLQSARKANSRRRQIRRGAWALHQRKRKHTGRTFNLSQAFQTEHPKGDEMTLIAVVTSQKQNTDCCPRCFCPRCNRG